MSTCLESLNTELLLEIMEYLDAYDMIFSFHGLNGRFNSLLQACYLHIRFDKLKHDRNIWKRLISFIHGSQVRCLSFDQSDQSIHLLYFPDIDENLRTLSLENISKSSMEFIFERLPMVNQIKSLSVKNCWFPVTSQDGTVESFIFGRYGQCFASLIECSLVLMAYSSSFPSVSIIFKYLRRLSLNDSRWTSDTLIFLFKNTPNLRTLRLRPYGKFSQVSSSTEISLSHIRELEVLLSHNTSELPSLLALFPGLRRLRIAYYGLESNPAVDGQGWQKIIEDHLRNLRHMTLDFCDDEDENEIDAQFLSTFQTGEFWWKKQVTIKTTTDEVVCQQPIVKKIHFGKPWSFDMSTEKNRM